MKKLMLLATVLIVSSVNQSWADGHGHDAAEKVEHKAVEHKAAVENAVKDVVKDAGALCLDAGPQTPRDISNIEGKNMADFAMAPSHTELNLCNIHTHTNAEHKGPGFNVFVNDSDHGGYACNEAGDLSDAERAPYEGKASYEGVKSGDTIEVHWVHSSCDVKPGPTLGSCLTDTCTDPLLRVETQVFLVVNDEDALDFNDFAYGDTVRDERHQAKAIPGETGEPIVFRGSTTGPKFTQSQCSPFKVTWSVRPQCAKVNIASLHKWAEGNVFEETHSHGVRQLVTAPELLSPIQ
jgi:hypothetical protein